MKRLTLFSIRSFAGPFVVTFLISMFILIMQFFWVYIDDLMGKGIELIVILELLWYISGHLIPLALPLAILLSSIMTFGNLAENNELTALKSSGLSLFKIMRPLMNVVLLLSLATFYFANYVIPAANLKWHTLIYDIQETKVTALLTPGSYSKAIDNYAIKVQEGHDNSFKKITIHDYTNPTVTKTIKADSGEIYTSTNGKYLFFRLVNGRISEELNSQPPIFQPDGKVHHGGGSFRPGRRTAFAVATYKMDLSGFKLNRSDQDFGDEYEMLNVFQINQAQDSIQKEYNKTLANFVLSLENDHPYFLSVLHKPDSSVELLNKVVVAPYRVLTLDSMKTSERIAAINSAVSKLRRKNTNLQGQADFMGPLTKKFDLYAIEFHRKFALTATIFVLFCIGAPLGAIVRKGGFGAPVVIAALLFMVYFVLISIGDNLAGSGVLEPFWGMWLPTMVLTPVALLLLTSAANDLSLGDRKFWRLIFSFGRRR